MRWLSRPSDGLEPPDRLFNLEIAIVEPNEEEVMQESESNNHDENEIAEDPVGQRVSPFTDAR